MEFDLDKIVSEMDFTGGQFVTCKNGLMLTNNEISVLISCLRTVLLVHS